MRIFFLHFISFLLCCMFLLQEVGQTHATSNVPTISTNHYILMESTTGRVLLEENADERMPIASITKVMTAVVALQYGNLDDQITISRDAIQTEGSSIYLEEEEKVTLEDLLYGLMLRSGNDAAKAIAEHIGESEEGFTYLMNETAEYLGMTNSHFMNPHGLDEPGHYSSAHDMALLMSYAMMDETFAEISQTKSYQATGRTYPWRNKNKLLTSLYPYSTGGKTGFTTTAGRTLVSTASKNHLDLITVTLNAPEDWQDHINLFDYGFSAYELVRLAKHGDRTFSVNGKTKTGHILEDVVLPLTQREQDNMHNTIQIYTEPNHDHIGKMVFKVDRNKELREVPLFHAETKKAGNDLKWWEHLWLLGGTSDND